MHKHFRLPGDPVLPGTLFSGARFPGVHRGGHEIIILTGPERIFASYGLATLRLVGVDSVDDARAPESSRAPAPVISPLIDPVPASKEKVN